MLAPRHRAPAYELACDGETKRCDRTHRILARKLDSRDEWIVVAWAAAGPDADVAVELPGAGTITVSARPAGSLYHVVGGGGVPAVELVDIDPTHPTDLLAP